MEDCLLSFNVKLKEIENNIKNIRTTRWFLIDELEFILQDNSWKHFGYRQSIRPPQNPLDGEIYFFDKKVTPKFKNDGIVWSRRKSNEKAQESYHNFKINKIERIAAIYCRAMDNKNFCRRIYSLIDKEKSSIVMVHYRESISDDSSNSTLVKSYASYWRSFNINYSELIPVIEPCCDDVISIEDMSIDSDTLNELQFWSEQSPIHKNDQLVCQTPLNIIDFAPNKENCPGGSKLIIVVDKPINLINIKICFGDIVVQGEILTSTAIRCYTPMMQFSNRFKITLVDEMGTVISNPSVEEFEYFQKLTFTNQPILKQEKTRSDSIDNERERKIRIVEKLGKTILGSTEVSNDSPIEAVDNHLKWLTDAELSNLSSIELEKVMDTYVSLVVKQLVQLASFDDDLKNEMNSLDSCGYSLLHYCCLYNLSNLVSILLNKGVSIDLKSSNHGMTALVIAVNHGYIELVKLLVDSGANVNIVDDNGNSPYDIAISKGYYEIASYLKIKLRNTSCNIEINQVTSNEDLTNVQSNTLPTNTMLLQEAFSSLSLVDKCALSLSIGSMNNPVVTSTSISPSHSRNSIMDSYNEPESLNSTTSTITDIEFDMQSVISESDKESLDVAMSMMGQNELNELNNEVKIIQSNVRTWLLRKNYINLRESARVLQGFWREKRRIHVLQTNTKYSNDKSLSNSSIISIQQQQREYNRNNASMLSYNDKQLHAVETLQAATRGMIARKSFNNIRRQAMASLTIQKVLYVNK